jgi:ABC-type cobalamin transport system permease subunit
LREKKGVLPVLRSQSYAALREPIHMAASQRPSRGFRLALFLAAIPLLIGIGVSFFVAKDSADKASQAYQQLLCAHRYIATNQSWLMSAPDGAILDLIQIGCSDRPAATISLGEARTKPVAAEQLVSSSKLWVGLVITFAVSIAVYGIVRAIGWAIGGFAPYG